MLLKLKEETSGMGKSTMLHASKLNKVRTGKYTLASATRMTLSSMKKALGRMVGKPIGVVWGVNWRWGSKDRAQAPLSFNLRVKRRRNNICRGTGIEPWKGVSLTLQRWEKLRRLMGRNYWRGVCPRHRGEGGNQENHLWKRGWDGELSMLRTGHAHQFLLLF